MSYYIIPKIKNWVVVNPKKNKTENIEPYISCTLYQYYNEICNQIHIFLNKNEENAMNYEEITKIVHPFEYIFSKVPGSKFAVSKLKPKTNLFYDFLEISNTLSIFEPYKNKIIQTLHLTKHNHDSIECFEMLRENYSDKIICYDEINDDIITLIGEKKFDFLFFEANLESLHLYFISLIQFTMVILRNQNESGTCLIKVNNIFHKPVVELLYLLSSLYEKVYILKPNSSNITTFDKYIVCKNFQYNPSKARHYKLNYFRLLIFLKKLDNQYIESLLDFNVSYHFTIKIKTYPGGFFNQENKEEKIENIKKSNIQKSVSWCEKYKIPFNKFAEKTNIFLPIIREIIDDTL